MRPRPPSSIGQEELRSLPQLLAEPQRTDQEPGAQAQHVSDELPMLAQTLKGISDMPMMLGALSLPLIPIATEVIVMPLKGSIDVELARPVLETLLVGTAYHRARIVILDFTGVPVINAFVGHLLVHAAWAVQVLGAQVVLTGVGPERARTLSEQQIDLSEMVTHTSLRDGIAFALNKAPQPSTID